MSTSVVTPQLVVLSSRVWVSGLAAELQRLGLADPERADRAARHALHRIIGAHGWPRECIEVAGPNEEEVEAQ
jgi:hypothetical protein